MIHRLVRIVTVIHSYFILPITAQYDGAFQSVQLFNENFHTIIYRYTMFYCWRWNLYVLRSAINYYASTIASPLESFVFSSLHPPQLYLTTLKNRRNTCTFMSKTGYVRHVILDKPHPGSENRISGFTRLNTLRHVSL